MSSGGRRVRPLEGELNVEVDLRVDSEQAEVVSEEIGFEPENELIKVHHVRPRVVSRLHHNPDVLLPVMHLPDAPQRKILRDEEIVQRPGVQVEIPPRRFLAVVKRPRGATQAAPGRVHAPAGSDLLFVQKQNHRKRGHRHDFRSTGSVSVSVLSQSRFVVTAVPPGDASAVIVRPVFVHQNSPPGSFLGAVVGDVGGLDRSGDVGASLPDVEQP